LTGRNGDLHVGQVKITNIQLNQTAQKKDGSSYNVHKIVLMNEEKGTTKSEQVPTFKNFSTPITELAIGDIVNAKYVQNGNFWNLADLTLISKGAGGSAPTVQAPAGKSYGGGGGYKDDPEKQMMIVRQNVKGTAADVVLKLVEVGVYDKKKLAPDFVVDEILRIAKRFEAYCMCKEETKAITDAVETVDTPAFNPEEDVF
jgi:hypothetical protein